MTKYHLIRIASLALCGGLAACSSNHEANELSQKSVSYQCGLRGQQELDLDVRYTFQGDDPVTAQVLLNNQALNLTRDTNNRMDMVGNSFSGSGYTWTTGKFTFENADDVDGNMLTQTSPQAMNGGAVNGGGVNGAPAMNNGGSPAVGNILAQNCKVK